MNIMTVINTVIALSTKDGSPIINVPFNAELTREEYIDKLHEKEFSTIDSATVSANVIYLQMSEVDETTEELKSVCNAIDPVEDPGDVVLDLSNFIGILPLKIDGNLNDFVSLEIVNGVAKLELADSVTLWNHLKELAATLSSK